LELTL